MKIHTFPQNTPEWDEVRRGKITGSCASILMPKNGLGKGAESYAKVLVMERMGVDLSYYDYKSDAMYDGSENEQFVREAYAKKYGVEVDQVGFIEMDDQVGCSPDGLVGTNGMIEIYCPKPKAHLELWLTDKIEKTDQIQFNLMVSGRDWCDFIAWNGDGFPARLGVYKKRIFRDEPYIKLIEQRVEEMKGLIEGIQVKINQL